MENMNCILYIIWISICRKYSGAISVNIYKLAKACGITFQNWINSMYLTLADTEIEKQHTTLEETNRKMDTVLLYPMVWMFGMDI